MSTTAIDCMNTAASLISDPGMTSVTPDQWLAVFNQSQRKLATRIDLVEAEAYFDLQLGVQRYSYPADCTTVTGIWWTATPSDTSTFTPLHEAMRPEFKDMVTGGYPSGDPSHYYCKLGWFYMIPMLDRTIAGGGLISYYYVPADIVDPATTVEWPDFFRDCLVEHMQIAGMYRLKQIAEAKALEQRWEATLPEIKDRAEDRSNDRPPALRPRLFASMSRRSQV